MRPRWLSPHTEALLHSAGPARRRAVAVGPGPVEELLAQASGLLPRASGTSREETAAPSASAPRPRTTVLHPATPQTLLRLGGLVPGRGHDDYPALQLAVLMLGGYYASRLTLVLRERSGLAYAPRAVLDPLGPRAVLTVEADVRHDGATRALDLVAEETERLAARRLHRAGTAQRPELRRRFHGDGLLLQVRAGLDVRRGAGERPARELARRIRGPAARPDPGRRGPRRGGPPGRARSDRSGGGPRLDPRPADARAQPAPEAHRSGTTTMGPTVVKTLIQRTFSSLRGPARTLGALHFVDSLGNGLFMAGSAVYFVTVVEPARHRRRPRPLPRRPQRLRRQPRLRAG
ncbi:insulinase family protein [Streptomyces lasalocidi]